MKITGLVFCLVLLSSPIVAAQMDQTAIVPTLTWVEVQNAEPARNGNGEFQTGEHCNIARGESIKVVAENEGRLLAEYVGRSAHEVTSRHFGAECPLGTLFFIDPQDFDGMTNAFYLEPAL